MAHPCVAVDVTIGVRPKSFFGVSCGAKILIGLGCLWALAGCATVTINDAAGRRDISIHPFKIETVNREADTPQVISASVLGLSSTASGFDLGLRHEEIVVAPAKCHAVLVVRSEIQAQAAGAMAEAVEKRCIVHAKGG